MSLPALAEALRARGGTIAGLVSSGVSDDPSETPPRLAAHGPRTAPRAAEYELLLEMILEGSLLHYGAPRVLTVDDPDLALLLGDQLYALGLSRLADLGDLDAVAELADLISLLALARATSNAPLADAVWEAGAASIGWGASSEHEAAKALARAGDDRAPEALHASARHAFAEPPPGRSM